MLFFTCCGMVAVKVVRLLWNKQFNVDKHWVFSSYGPELILISVGAQEWDSGVRNLLQNGEQKNKRY